MFDYAWLDPESEECLEERRRLKELRLEREIDEAIEEYYQEDDNGR